MSEFKIDKDVPLPPPRNKSKYPFDDMEIGDSFFVADKHPNQLSGSIHLAKRRLGWRFLARTVDGGTRIWRVK